MPTNPKSYWNGNGKYQALSDALSALLPWSGEVADHQANQKLERFRKAVNVYYDVFNNGCGNRGREFKPTFGLRLSDYRCERYGLHTLDFDRLMVDLEEPMSKYVLEAAAEQIGKLPQVRS